MPRSYRLSLSPQASEDLRVIFDYIAARSPQNAAKMIDEILASIELLKPYPHRTIVEPQTPGAEYPVRSLPVWPYVIFFRVMEAQQVVRILQVRHGSQRRPARFDD